MEEHFSSPRSWGYQGSPWKITRGYIGGHAEKGCFRQRAQYKQRECKRVVGDEAIKETEAKL